jgi:hypothetical protein
LANLEQEQIMRADIEPGDPMVPHTLMLKPGLVIHSLYNGGWDAGDRSGFFHDVDLDPSLRTAA